MGTSDHTRNFACTEKQVVGAHIVVAFAMTLFFPLRSPDVFSPFGQYTTFRVTVCVRVRRCCLEGAFIHAETSATPMHLP